MQIALLRGSTLSAKLITSTYHEVNMTTLNFTTKTDKSALLEMVGKPIFINDFYRPEGYLPMPPGYYFIDAVIFHYYDNIELGISKYDSLISPEQFDLDTAHLGYFSLHDLSIECPNSSKPQDLLLTNPIAPQN